MSLKKYRGCTYLTPAEKGHRLRLLDKCVQENEVDVAFIPYLHALNDFPFICTTQCCTGHPDRDNTAHIDFRSALSFEDTFRATQSIVNNDEYRASLEIMGQELTMPRYCLWIGNGNKWTEAMDELIENFAAINARIPGGLTL